MRKSGLLLSLLIVGLTAMACGKKMTEEEIFTKAKEYEMSEEYDKSESMYQKLVKEFPEGVRTEEARRQIALLQNARTMSLEELKAEIAQHESLEDSEGALILYNRLVQRFRLLLRS